MFLQERRGDGNKLSNVKGFVILWPVEGLTSFNKDNSANFSGEKKNINEAFRVSIFRAEENANKLQVKSRPRI